MSSILFIWILAQSLLLKPAVPQITVTPSTSAVTVARGGSITLWADVAPKPKMHVYASAKQGFTPLSLVMTPQAQVTIGKVIFPAPESGITPGSDMLIPIPMYSQPFRLAVPVTVSSSAKSGDVFTLVGVVNYQACNDKVCFAAASVPATWIVTVK